MLRGLGAPVVNANDDARANLFRGQVRGRDDAIQQARLAELFAAAAEGLYDAVRVADEQVAGPHLHRPLLVTTALENAQHRAAQV